MEISKYEILLSFIIPVYNVEMYLRECVDSIVHQITDRCEIILVNDGSTDSSGEICRSYAERDMRIHLITKENGGLSSARNAGLSAAKGKYVTFVDSDDKIFPDTVSHILHWIQSQDADLCFLQSVKLYPDGSYAILGEGITHEGLYLQNREAAIYHLASRPKYPGSAWGKLYKRDYLHNNDLHFPHDRRYSEDLGFVRDCILCAQSMDMLDIPYYQYRQSRNGSITNKISAKNFGDLVLFISESVEKLTDNNTPRDIISRHGMGFVAYEYMVLLHLYHALDPKDKKNALCSLRKFKWTLKYALNAKAYLTKLLCTVFGLRIASSILAQYRKASK